MVFVDKTYDEFKKQLGGEVLSCLERYEDSIEDFIKNIVEDGIQNIYSNENLKRIERFRFMTYGAILLSENTQDFSMIYVHNEKEISSQLKEWGMNIDEIGHQFGSAVFNAYVAATEDIRKHLMLFVDFESVQSKGMLSRSQDIGKLTFSTAINCLRKIYPDNEFLTYLQDIHVPLRNLVAHYNYTWENKKLCLYEGVFDEEPQSQYELKEFLQLALNLYALSAALFLIYEKILIDPL
ncbi:MAG: hypothetical protein DRN17_00265 [Thermoplasmata archaeon]|nr:MAG: hypothetical protein DRN17_00265 [Thermoplasmata archaeon]